MGFSVPLDIANRALRYCEVRPISAFTENSKAGIECSAAFDKLRQNELRARLWKFSQRTTVLRAITSTSQVLAFPAYASGTTYAGGRIVSYAGYDGNLVPWISVQGSNVGNTPTTSPAFWQLYFGSPIAETYSSAVSYYTGEVAVSSGTFYISNSDGNLNNAPASGAPWIALTGVTGTTLFNPGSLTANRAATVLNAFPLPYGFMRIAPQDPKSAGTSYSATSGGMQFSNLEFRGKYIVTSDASPLILRFGADTYDVTAMDPQFCELVAASMGMAMIGVFTGNPGKKQSVEQSYANQLSIAAKMNAIEIGNTEADEAAYTVSRDPEDLTPAQPAR